MSKYYSECRHFTSPCLTLFMPINTHYVPTIRVTKTDRAINVKEKADNLLNTLDAFRAQVFSKWKKDVPSDIEHYLKESLLIVFHNKLIELNFHRQVTTMRS